MDKTFLKEWLSEVPPFTTFRINSLQSFDSKNLEEYFHLQKQVLNVSEIPKYYFLKNDCLVVGRWPNGVEFGNINKEVIVDAACGASVLRGAHVFAPGVLGLPTNCKLDEIINVYCDMEGHCKRGLKIPYEGNKQYVGVGILKKLRCDLFDNGIAPSGIAVHILLPASRLPVINEKIYPTGQILLQNLPSIVTGWVVDPKPHELILDMCASPGNKTTHLAEMSGDKAVIIAIDKTEPKVARIVKNCEIQGVSCVKAYAFDSTKCFVRDSLNKLEPPFPANNFDKILLDAPCSGLGQRPQLNNKMSEKMLQSYKFVQRKLMAAAVEILKVGGELTYSTCTVTKEENEWMVAWVLEKFPFVKLVPAEPLKGGPGLSNCGLTDEQRIMVQRFGPIEDELRPVEDIYRNSIGFFIAKFIRTDFR
ncbi:tRNA (cytosine(72)-C(5))-methyltransferase NSUN6 [Aricia agestis]|uniref:tRNA (cytosine(72)-C(5))-methyltransferase NSUN6 n=1 Tax=Aricia agestis TaxID=91739 RepID=UPI001C20A7CC|nr:tRNA (cytosine(72)-C(5))-methyltransferase NSUN6 [Aricia agestis]